MQSKRQENKALKREQIIEAAYSCFAERGLAEVQMKDIAERAGVGVATVFRYFPKKDHIIVAVATRSLDAVEDEFKRIASLPATAYERLEMLLDMLLDLQNAGDAGFGRFREAFESYASFQSGPLPNIEDYLERQRTIMGHLAPLLTDGQRDGSIRSDVPQKLLLITVINSFASFIHNVALKAEISYLDDEIQPEQQQHMLKHALLAYCKRPDA